MEVWLHVYLTLPQDWGDGSSWRSGHLTLREEATLPVWCEIAWLSKPVVTPRRRETYLALPGIEFRFLVRPSHTLVAVPTDLFLASVCGSRCQFL